MTNQNGDRTFDRPIDDYPRVRDTGRWVLRSGVVPFLAGLWFVYRAWTGVDPGVSALMAFLLGASFAAVWSLTHGDSQS